MQPPIITLTTDFGLADSYVAQLKAVMLAIHPRVHLVDVTHEIPAQNVRRAAAVLDEVVNLFPEGTIHLTVVDPGVGTERRLIAVEAAGQRFVAPDNGVLSAIFRRLQPSRIIELTERRFWRQSVSHTFHGRDIMAPVAAHLSLGTNLAELGRPLEGDPADLPDQPPSLTPDGVVGEIIWVDAFGNLITNIDESLFPVADRARLTVEVGDQLIKGIHRCYDERGRGELLALIGSHGRLEIAVNRGSAAERLGAVEGDHVRLVAEGAG
jgi:S-adenosylmethionine hydrolase